MNTKIYCLLSVMLLAVITAWGQPQLKKPIKTEEQLKQELFELDKYQYNHTFRANLPDDNFLIVDFYKLSYWPEEDLLPLMFETAATVAQKVNDSFKSLITSKRIDVHLPVKNRPITLRLKEHDDGSDMITLNYDQQAPLKLGMDTIRILKTVVSKEDDKEAQKIQYTFVLKDMADIAALAKDTKLIERVTATFDSIVNNRREHWSAQDVWYHKIKIDYSPTVLEKENQLDVDYNKPGFLNGLDVDYYIGVGVFRNTVAPYLEVGASYKWVGKNPVQYSFVKLSTSTMPLFERLDQATYNIYQLSYVNLEIGTLINKTDTWIPLYESSVGFGYLFTDHPSILPHEGGKMFWNFSLSPTVRITPELFCLFRKGQDNRVWPGVTLSLKFL